jgi:DNA-directed RNA polymerase sigma subunit (sigma70/sigma32)
VFPAFGPATAAALEALPPRDAHVLRHRGGAELHGRSPRTLEALGREMGVTRERVRQLEQRAWRRVLTLVRDTP